LIDKDKTDPGQRSRKSGLNKVVSKLENTPNLLIYFTRFAGALGLTEDEDRNRG
jgi:hypothetical protein